MATYTAYTSTGNHYTLTLIVEETDVDVNNNRSKVRYKAYLTGDAATSSYGDANYTVTVNGVATSGTFSYNFGSTKTYYCVGGASSWKTSDYIGHNSDGTKKISVAFNLSGNSYVGTGSINNTFTMQTIPRASTITCNKTVLEAGGTATVTITKYSASFTTNTSYTVNGGTAVNLGTGTSYNLTYATIAAQIGSYSSGEVVVTCVTTNGGTTIGSNSVRFTVSTGTIPMSWYDNRSGSVGVTIGKKATQPGFNVYAPSKFSTDGGTTINGTLTNYIVESTVNANNGYNVYSNGLVEMWGTVSGSATANTMLSLDVSFPKTLASANACVLVSALGGATHYVRDTTYSDLTTTGMKVSCYRDNAANITISWFVRGKV